MATTYHDFESSDYSVAESIARGKRYLGELRLMAGAPDTAADGKSISRGALAGLITSTENRLRELASMPGARVNGGISHASHRRP